MNTPITMTSLHLDGGTQSREAMDQKVIAEYVASLQEGAVLPAVTVFKDDAGKYWLADGFHRFHAYDEIGHETIICDVIEGELRDAILFSLGTNATHGLRRTNADKRKAVRIMLEDDEWVSWSNREIARRCQVGEALVRGMREDHTAFKRSMDSDQPTETTFIHPKTGQPATMNTTNIGAAASTPAPPEPDTWVTDEEGQCIDHPNHLRAFEQREQLKQLRNKLQGVKRDLDQMMKDGKEATAFINSTDIAPLKKVIGNLKLLMPHSLCCYCGGDGCEACNKMGWLPLLRWNQAPDSMKANLDEPLILEDSGCDIPF